MFWRRKKIRCQFNKPIALSTPIEKITFTVLDIEATGFNVGLHDRIIEIGAVKVEGLIVSRDTFHTYINPQQEIPVEITELTGIDEKTVQHAPMALIGIKSLLQFMEKTQTLSIVGCNIIFDVTALEREMQRANYAFVKPPMIDITDLIRFLNPTEDIRDLEQYACKFKTPRFKRHTALGDAFTTAHIFCYLLHKFKERGHNTWGELLYSLDCKNRNTVRF